MPRIRSVKPELWTDSKIVALSMPARLLFIGAWNYADDYGCLPADATQLKLRVLPADNVDADEVVGELLTGGLLEVLESSGGVQFWHVTHWDRHQRVSHAKEGDYGLPDTWRKPVTRGNAPDTDPLPNIPEDSGGFMGDGKGVEGNGSREPNGSRPRRPPKGAGPKELAFHAVLEDLFGVPSDTEMGLRRKICQSVMAAGADPLDVRTRAEAWKALFPPANGRKMTLTAPALDKWWGQLGLVSVSESFDPVTCSHPGDRQAVIDGVAYCGMCKLELVS